MPGILDGIRTRRNKNIAVRSAYNSLPSDNMVFKNMTNYHKGPIPSSPQGSLWDNAFEINDIINSGILPDISSGNSKNNLGMVLNAGGLQPQTKSGIPNITTLGNGDASYNPKVYKPYSPKNTNTLLQTRIGRGVSPRETVYNNIVKQSESTVDKASYVASSPKKQIPSPDPTNIYDKMRKWDTALAGFEIGANAVSAFQAMNAKPTTVTAPRHVNLETPKISSDVEANLALVKENMGTAINSNIDAAKERGIDPTKYAPGLFAQAGRLMRESAGQLTGRNQDLINQREVGIAETQNKENMMNTEIDNQYIVRRDQALAQDSMMRGQQLSQAVSNVGAISSRLMNTYMQTEMIKDHKQQAADELEAYKISLYK